MRALDLQRLAEYYLAAMKNETPKIVLASASPRRVELLSGIGLDFTVRPVEIEEIPRSDESGEAFAVRVAGEKALKSRDEATADIHIGCDTVVLVDGEILGKPADRDDAVRMLRLLSGRSHQVLTAVALACDTLHCDFCVTQVSFDALGEHAIEWYVDTGEPMDKAGAYGIQGRASLFVARIEGSYSNVVGLPIQLLPELFRKQGYDLYRLLKTV